MDLFYKIYKIKTSINVFFCIKNINMSTEAKNYMTWDKESAAKAAKQHKYIFVSENQKQKKFKVLSGAEKSWNPGKGKQPTNYIYLPDRRIMGLKDHVITALKNGGVSDAE